MNVGRKRGRTAANRETVMEIRDVIARETSGYRPGGLRCDFDRLSEDEQWKVIELVREAGEGGAWSWKKLGKRSRSTLEKLIEEASDARGVFEDARSMEEIAEIAAEAHTAAVRRPLSRREEVTVFGEIARCIAQGWLTAADLAVLVAFVSAVTTGKPLGPRSRVERVGDHTVLVIDDANMGPFAGSFDPESQVTPRWKQSVDLLEKNEWVTVERLGKQWTVGPGRRLLLAMAGMPVKDNVVAA
jgi:hypothetical protein